VRFLRDRLDRAVEQFVVVHRSEHRHGPVEPSQDPVVAVAAATEPTPVGVDGQRGHDHDLDVGDPAELGLTDLPTVRINTEIMIRIMIQIAVQVPLTRLAVVEPSQARGPADHGQDDVDAAPGECDPQRMGVGLARTGHIDRDPVGRPDLGDLEDDVPERVGGLPALGFGAADPFPLDGGTQSGLGRPDRRMGDGQAGRRRLDGALGPQREKDVHTDHPTPVDRRAQPYAARRPRGRSVVLILPFVVLSRPLAPRPAALSFDRQGGTIDGIMLRPTRLLGLGLGPVTAGAARPYKTDVRGLFDELVTLRRAQPQTGVVFLGQGPPPGWEAASDQPGAARTHLDQDAAAMPDRFGRDRCRRLRLHGLTVVPCT
jgi:hypothetical protein